MYFVTITKKPYVLFCMTQSERGALGLLEDKTVQILKRQTTGDWQVIGQWDGNTYSHTDFMVGLHNVAEPDDPAALLDRLPAGVLA